MRRCLLAVLAMAVALPACAASPTPLSFYECLRCPSPPVIDGKLDDPCWQRLPVMDQFFKYWTPTPQPPPLKTAARLCHDDRGLYLGITMYEDQLDKIRAAVDSRDDPHTWMDDCVEVMIDPGNSGTGYYKFCTNYNAARYDEKAANMVLDSGWNVEGWQVKTSRGGEPTGAEANGEGAWYIEFFFPWTDLDHKPAAGDIWSFALVRYGYSSGGFKGVSWSLGGAGAAPAKFGYLGFGPFTDATLPRLAAAAAPTKGKHLRLLTDTEVLTYDQSRWQRAELRGWLKETLRPADADLDEARAAVDCVPAGADQMRLKTAHRELLAKLNDLRDQAAAQTLAPVTAAMTDHQAGLLRQQARDLQYEALLLGLIAQQ